MSQEAPTSRKEKRAQRDAERHKGGKKRKRDEVEEQTPAAAAARSELQQDFISLDVDAGNVAVSTKKAKKKDKKNKTTPDPQPNVTTPSAGVVAETAAHPDQPKSKKRRRANPSAAPASGKTADESAVAAEPTPPKPTSGKAPRFILFIGNLPYTTTDASLQTHFKKIAPFTLRHRTDPQTKRSKGFAFLEFENFDRMKTCLKLYHHSLFDPADPEAGAAGVEGDGGGVGAEKDEKEKKKNKGKSNARRINVELTAGGGGSKAEGRREKIKAKNVRLDEQRKRRAEAERKEREKEAGGGGGGGKKGGKKDAGAADGKDAQPAVVVQGDAAQVHPSRLARVMG